MAPAYDIDIGKLVSDREAFNRFVYTPIDEAMQELERRRGDHELENKISFNKDNNLPSPLQTGPRAVLFRHIATPNYELIRFMNIAEMAGLRPLILEYTSDIFYSVNKCKYFLANLPFYKGIDKTSKIKVEYKNIIDFNSSNSKPLADIKTLWGQRLVDFHHEFFLKYFHRHKENIFDLSDWLKQNGKCSKGYYKLFLSLFLNNAILFENFLLDGPELKFTKDVILPALIEIRRETGYKPLIVALEPTKVEDDLFWMCHTVEDKNFVKDKQKPKSFIRKILSALKI
jgi:hypothetical protein